MAAQNELNDYCPRMGARHKLGDWRCLGKLDNGRFAWRCGNCLEVREGEEGKVWPDLDRAATPIAAAVSA